MNPDNYGSLPACKKLAEILAKKGIGVVTEAAWCEYGPDDWRIGYRGLIEDDPLHRKFIPAYSMAEVFRELPAEDVLYHYFDKHKHFFWYDWKAGQVFSDTNPNDALIELWIWVLEQEGKG